MLTDILRQFLDGWVVLYYSFTGGQLLDGYLGVQFRRKKGQSDQFPLAHVVQNEDCIVGATVDGLHKQLYQRWQQSDELFQKVQKLK